MTSQTQQTSDDSGSNYSQSTYSSDDDATTGDADHQPATTSNRQPGTSETVTEKAGHLTKDDSDTDTDNPLEQMLLSLRNTMNDKILKAADMAKSMDHDEACQQSLDEALNRVAKRTLRKEHYKNETRELEEKNKSLEKEVDDLKARANTLQAGMNAARERAMGLFE